MNRIDRLLGVLTLLQSKKYVPAETLAERFDISVRTVYRDVRALCEQGIPVSFEPGKGYFVVQGYFLPPVAFTTEEANALVLVEQVVKGFADASIRKHYATALNKVKSVLRGAQKETLEALQPGIRIQVPARLQHNFAYLSLLQQCIASKTIVSITYNNVQNERSQRKVEPIGLVFYAFGWHLIGWCHLRQEYRDFKLERVAEAHNTGQPFTRQEHISLDEYMQHLPVAY